RKHEREESHAGIKIKRQRSLAISGNEIDQLICKETIGLEERSGADRVRSKARVIFEHRYAIEQRRLLRRKISLSRRLDKAAYPNELRQMLCQSLAKVLQSLLIGFRRDIQFQEELIVLLISEKLNLIQH